LCYTTTVAAQDPDAHPPSWDERYAPFIQCVGFLPLARLMPGDLPMMDSATLMALVDRWHPETHTFHLLCGETTVMLQDIVMILGLPIDGALISGMVSLAGCRDSVAVAIGLRPPPPRSSRLEGQENDGHSLRVALSSL
jgi:hypothetical protein